MYFPYLRGRQFELLALQELLSCKKMGEHILPIIEPIKFSPTLRNTINAFIHDGHQIAIVMNPQVGDLVDETGKVFLDDMDEIDFSDRNIIKAYISNDHLPEKMEDNDDLNDGIIINRKRDDYNCYHIMYHDDIEPLYALIPDDRMFIKNTGNTRVLFADRFNKLPRNSDYKKIEDEFFSEDHLYYKEDFAGFSDYSIVGDDFNMSGFAPLAVVIHIVYFDADKTLRIRHFVSDSNYDINDPAKKYGEALTKLVKWISQKKKDSYFLETEGIQKFLESYDEKRYPGLGTVKKYSIMHHLELINCFLDREGK